LYNLPDGKRKFDEIVFKIPVYGVEAPNNTYRLNPHFGNDGWCWVPILAGFAYNAEVVGNTLFQMPYRFCKSS
jgi:hypothetical protein